MLANCGVNVFFKNKHQQLSVPFVQTKMRKQNNILRQTVLLWEGHAMNVSKINPGGYSRLYGYLPLFQGMIFRPSSIEQGV